jgi:hypothetical protein
VALGALDRALLLFLVTALAVAVIGLVQAQLLFLFTGPLQVLAELVDVVALGTLLDRLALLPHVLAILEHMVTFLALNLILCSVLLVGELGGFVLVCWPTLVVDHDIVRAFDNGSGKRDPEKHHGDRQDQKAESLFQVHFVPHERSSQVRVNVRISAKELEQPVAFSFT